MKLYNLYQNIILEEIIRTVELNEAVPSSEIDSVIKGDPNVKGKFYYVSFDYKDKDGTTSNRWVKIHQKNLSTAGNDLIDAKQISKNGKTSETVVDKDGISSVKSVEGWRKFNLDKMSNFKVSKVPFQQPEAGFNPTGNNSKTVAYTNAEDIADFSYGYKDPKYAEKVAAATKVKNDAFVKNRGEEKLKRQQKLEPKLNPQPISKPMEPKLTQPVQKPIDTNEPINDEPEMDNDLENKDELNK